MSTVGPTVNLRQIKTLTSASLRSRYRNSIAGLFWVVLNPIFMFAAQAYAFKLVLKIQLEHYALFLLTGLLPWIFMAQSVTMSTTLFTTNARLYKSFPIHPFSSLASIILDNLLNFSLATIILVFGFVFFSPDQLQTHLLLLPVPLFAVFLATLGLAWSLATLQVFFADTKFVFDFAIAMAFYITPIVYPIEFVEEQHRWIIEINPFTWLLAPLQALSRPQLPDDYFISLLRAYAIAFIFLTIAVLVWRKNKNKLYFRL